MCVHFSPNPSSAAIHGLSNAGTNLESNISTRWCHCPRYLNIHFYMLEQLDRPPVTTLGSLVIPMYFLFNQIMRKGVPRGRQILPPQAAAGPHLSLPRVLQLHQDPPQAHQLGRGEGDSRPGDFLDLMLTSKILT